MVSRIEPGTKGGKKTLFLKQNRAEIKAYFANFGAEETCDRYNLTHQTLERFLKQGDPIPRRDDRAVLLAQIASERSLRTEKQVKELEKKYALFLDSLCSQFVEKFFKPLLQNNIELPSGLEVQEDNLLKLDDMGHDSEAK